jgi:two-component system, sporulation sensor kinase E
MERELKKLGAPAVPVPRVGRTTSARRPSHAREESTAAQSVRRLQDFLAVARGEITRLDYIVTQFLQAIRPVPARKRPASLNAVVRQTLDLLRPELQNRAQSIEERLATRLPEIPLDPAQVQQALVNLIKNAMQAMTKGGVLTVETGAASEGVWVSIADTGCGIPQDQLNRIFEPFFTTKKQGSGLGLMIVQRIVREHGGLIKLESHRGRGTTFRIWLPAREPQPRLLEAHSHDQTPVADRGR